MEATSIGERLTRLAGEHPDRVALVDRSESGTARPWSYGELDRGARRVAGALADAKIAPGDRVALLGGNSAPLAVAWLGAQYRGVTLVPLPAGSAPAELRHRLGHAACRALLCDAALRRVAEPAVKAAGAVLIGLEAALTSSARPLTPVGLDPEGPAMILYTSGTTGVPRGALVSRRSLVAHAATLSSAVLCLGGDDVVLGALPLSHSFGSRIGLAATWLAGARVVVVPRFDPALVLHAMHADGVTLAPVVPTMLAALAEAPAGAPRPEALGWFLSAGAPLAASLQRRVEARLGVEVRQGYGLTEASFSAIDAPGPPRALGSVGRSVPGVSLRVVDERGRDQPSGELGEVWIRGANQMSGYLDDPAASAEVISPDGWVRSGDLGRLDGEGRLWIVDRLKDLILRGGHNVCPAELEAALLEHPEVREAAVVGRPDDRYGEEVIAVVVPRAGAAPRPERLREWLGERVARHKLPREWVSTDRLPVGSSGKVVRRALREAIRIGALVPVRLGRG